MKTGNDTLREIEVLIRARYPIIYILSWEEQRVLHWLMQVAKKRNKRLFEWSFSTGILEGGVPPSPQRIRSSTTKDPINALDEVIGQVEPAIYVFKDLHPFLTRNNFAVIRKLKDAANHIKDSYKTLIMVSPTLEIPPELEKDMTVVDFPLPEAEDFSNLLDRILAEVKDQPNVIIDIPPPAREQMLKAALGLTLNEAENVFAKTLVNDSRLTEQDIATIFAEKRQIIRKSGLLDYYDVDVEFGQVGGLDSLKEWLRTRALAFTDRAREYGLPNPKGVLLLGVQGCGKSLSAKAVSSLWKMPLLRLDMGRMFGSLVGSSEENIRQALRTAESIAPVILWLDEIDKALAGTRSSGSSDSGTTARVFGTFLTWLSEKKSPVFVIATANDISNLPPELLRKGRFDEIFFVDLPADNERPEIFAVHLRAHQRDPANFDLDLLAETSAGFSGAEIEEAVISGLFDAFAEDIEVTTRHIEKALRETVPLSKTMEVEIDRLRGWAEGRARPASSRETIVVERRRKIEI
ncbi:MAG: AAA family ATPase [bacterium]|nr:AAA family ATPase [Candidatus Sumerlaeota bacterium]